jgi:halocyanin-like protein
MTIHTRRQVLALGGATVAGALAGVRPAVAAPTDLSEWFENVDNADEVADRTSQSTVEIEVGAEGNGGAFAFHPAAVRIDPGTTVVWTWTGEGGSHNVVASEGAFESELTDEAGTTFEHTPAEPGVSRYLCTPHESLGMKGALIVGDEAVTLTGETGAGDSSGATPATQSGSGDAGADGGDGGDAGAADDTAGSEAAVDRERNQEQRFDGWLSETDGAGEVVDRTGREAVTISVGARENGGQHAFDPPVVRVSEGTTVVWEWITDGTEYRIREQDGAFESAAVAQVGHRYGVTFTGEGVWKYESAPQTDRGMRGVVVVGSPDSAGAADWGARGFVGGIGLLAALYAGAKMLERDESPTSKQS